MAASDYTDLATVKDEFGITDAGLDNRLSRAITDASRVLDAVLGRPPGAFAAQTLTRYYDVPAGADMPDPNAFWTVQRVQIDPCTAITSLKTDPTGDGTFPDTWTAGTDYLLYPLNDDTKREVVVNPISGRYAFPVGLRRLQIVGTFQQETSTPGPIRRACLLLAGRYWKRPDSPLGVHGNAEVGFTRLQQTDPDVAFILKEAGYVDTWLAV